MTTMPTMPRRPGRPGPARVEERLADGQQPPGEDHDVERQQRAEDLRRDDPGGESGRRLGWTRSERERDDDERRDQEEGRQPAPTVEQLAESRDQRRQARRGEAADGPWAWCRAGSGWRARGASDSSVAVGRRGCRRASLPGGGAGHGDAGRSISLP